jgi:hypothetical protein
MEKLPLEMLLVIASWLPQRSWNALHATCKRFGILRDYMAWLSETDTKKWRALRWERLRCQHCLYTPWRYKSIPGGDELEEYVGRLEKLTLDADRKKLLLTLDAYRLKLELAEKKALEDEIHFLFSQK